MTALSASTRRHLAAGLCSAKAADEIADILEVSNVLSSTEAAYLDSVTAGTGAASKAVVLDASADWFGPATGTFVFGHTAALTISDGDGATDCIPQHQIVGTTKATGSMLLSVSSATATSAAAPSLNFSKSAGAAAGAVTVVTSGEVLGEVNFFGANGTDLESCGVSLRATVAATPGASDMPGRFSVFCSSDGAETPLEKARVTGTATTAILQVGIATVATGSLVLAGATSDSVTIQPLGAAGNYTLTLPPDDGDAGEQLQTNGSGVLTFEAAGSMRAVKDVIEDLSGKAHEALGRIVNCGVYSFRYKENARAIHKLPALSDTKTEFRGIMAEEYPEVMMRDGKIFSPISAFGEACLAIKALKAEIESLKAQMA